MKENRSLVGPVVMPPPTYHFHGGLVLNQWGVVIARINTHNNTMHQQVSGVNETGAIAGTDRG